MKEKTIFLVDVLGQILAQSKLDGSERNMAIIYYMAMANITLVILANTLKKKVFGIEIH